MDAQANADKLASPAGIRSVARKSMTSSLYHDTAIRPDNNRYFLRVDSFKGTYSGQNEIRLVKKKMTANIPRMIAVSPDI